MCTFITCSLPETTDLEALDATLQAHGMHFRSLDNARVKRQLPADDRYGAVAPKDGCDCGTVLGCMALCGPDDDHDEDDEGLLQAQRLEEPILELKRKGWSPSQILAWLKQNAPTESADPEQSLVADVLRWIGILVDLVDKRFVNRLGLLIHEYTGSLEDEKITIKSRRVVRLKVATPYFLMRMKEDVLYEIVR